MRSYGRINLIGVNIMIYTFKLLLITFAIFAPLKAFAQDIDGTYKLVIDKSPVIQDKVDVYVRNYNSVLEDHSEGKEISQNIKNSLKKIGLYSEDEGFVTDQSIIQKSFYEDRVKRILNEYDEYQFHTLVIDENKFTFAAPYGSGQARPEQCTISKLNEINGLVCEGSRNLVGTILYDNQNKTISISVRGGKTVYKPK